MDRRDFLKAGGLGAAAIVSSSLLPSCRESGRGGRSLPGPESMPQNYPGVGLLGFGCMRWPMKSSEDGSEIIDQEKVDAMVDVALARGVNYFDTSPVYLEGESESATAKALSRYPRESYLLATKLSIFGGNVTPDGARAMYERSKEIFATDYIDYYLLHNLHDGADFKRRFIDTGMIDYFCEERRLGHIRNLGFSFHGKAEGFSEILAYHEQFHWDFVQIQMNYVDWRHAGGRNCNAEFLYNELDRREIPVVIMEPLRGGRLATLPSHLTDRLLEADPKASPASWAMRFFASYPRILTVLSGMSKMEHLEENLRTFSDFNPFSEEEKTLMESLAEDFLKYPLIRCTDCKYCMPCPYGIDIPGLLMYYNDALTEGTYVVSREQKNYSRARRKALARYGRAVETVRQADHCTHCGQCVEHCPQRINIPRELGKIDDYIEHLKSDR